MLIARNAGRRGTVSESDAFTPMHGLARPQMQCLTKPYKQSSEMRVGLDSHEYLLELLRHNRQNSSLLDAVRRHTSQMHRQAACTVSSPQATP